MYKTIWKYQLETKDVQIVDMPIGSEILCIQNQNETPCLWALADPKEESVEKRFFEIFGTGNPINYNMGVSRNYIGTYQLNNGELVFHLFEYTGI